jgi:hypothetical protein
MHINRKYTKMISANAFVQKVIVSFSISPKPVVFTHDPFKSIEASYQYIIDKDFREHFHRIPGKGQADKIVDSIRAENEGFFVKGCKQWLRIVRIGYAAGMRFEGDDARHGIVLVSVVANSSYQELMSFMYSVKITNGYNAPFYFRNSFFFYNLHSMPKTFIG